MNRMREIHARLERLEKAVFGSEPKTSTPRKHEGTGRGDLPTHILSLRNQGFFREPKTPGEVHTRLQSKYHCEPDRVAMALLRLRRRRKLRKGSKPVGKKKQVAYVW